MSYLAARPSTPGPLFAHQDGRPLSCPGLVRAVRSALGSALVSAGVDTSRYSYSGHSFRIGAATTAAQAGLQGSLIQTLGRWKSSAFLFYTFSGFGTTLALRLHFVFKGLFFLFPVIIVIVSIIIVITILFSFVVSRSVLLL